MPRWSGLPASLRLFSGWALTAAVFYVAGALPAALFVGLVAANELVVQRRPWIALGCLLALILVPAWVWYRPAFHPFASVGRWGSGLTLALHAAAWLWVGAWCLIRGGLDRWARPQVKPRVHRFALGLAALFALLWGSLDRSGRALAELEWSVDRQEWDRALSAARQVRAWPATARILLTRALFHAGRLPEDLFTFDQRRGLDLLPGYEAGLETARAQAQTLLELGQVNLAEHFAHESLELEGFRPDTLRLLATINLLKGRPEAARLFLNRLRLAPGHRAEAEHALSLLDADPGGANQPGLGSIRARLVRTDEPDSQLSTEALLRQLLESNPTNRMACEFLLVHHLLTVQLDELPADLGRLDAFGGSIVPRAGEEAILFCQDRAPDSFARLRGRPVRPATVDRYHRFVESLLRYRNRSAAAPAALAAEFGDTFWFYALFGETAPRPAAQYPHQP